MLEQGEPVSRVSNRVLTVPNALSALRLVGIPIFVWLALSGRQGWAFLVLAVSAVTDYLDGYVARRFDMMSRLGQLLDPIADRLYILATLFVLAVQEIVPLAVVVLLVAREAFLAGLMLRLRLAGQVGLPVHDVGKAATFNLLYAFPILLLSHPSSPVADVARPLGWAFAGWGILLYWVAAVLYGVQATRVLRVRSIPRVVS